MTIRKPDEKVKKKVLKIVIPDELVEDYLLVKKLAKKKGVVFDIKPEVIQTVKKAVDEALTELK
ncbi:MAG: hypothetical protein GY699_20695 [Desulfobacteraceae bacterium]|nr:hypothetical protein [Desulfobacteraceae bacterium]